MSSTPIRVVAVLLLATTLGACAPSMDMQKAASMERAQVREIAGADLDTFAKSRTAVLLTGADEATKVHVSKKNVQGLFRLKGTVCRTIGGCAAVPIDARGYWLTASHCLDSGAALIYVPVADDERRAVPARIVWKSNVPGQDLAILSSPLAEGMVPVEVSPKIRDGARIVCVGSGLDADPFSAGRVIGAGGATDGSVVWLEHNAPLTGGDSGGAAFYDDGVLAGINVQAGTSPSGKRARATAILPDMARIAQLISDDWEARSVPR